MRSSVLAVVALTACGVDPSLRVDVDHEGEIATTVVSVYESSAIGCEQVEFGDLDEGQLLALLVAEQTLDTGGVVSGRLAGLSRTDQKVIVARGYDADGGLREAGCAVHGEITEDDAVEVRTVPIASVSAVTTATDPFTLGVFVTDPAGVPLHGRRVAWRMYGPAGSAPAVTTNVVETGDGDWQPVTLACTTNGFAALHPVTPDVVGGYAASVRASWAESSSRLFSGIAGDQLTPTALQIPNETTHPCAIQAAGATRRLVCIDRNLINVFARAYPVTVSAGRAVLGAPTDSLQLPGIRPPVGVFAAPNGTTREVFAVDNSGQLTPLFGASAVQPTSCPTCDASVTDFSFVPSCGAESAKLVLQVGTTAQVMLVPARGGTASPLALPANVASVRLNSAGCVTTNTGAGSEVRQMIVLDLVLGSGLNEVAATVGFYGCSASACTRQIVFPVAEAGVGFTTTGPPYVIGAAVDATGVVLSTWGLLPDPGAPSSDRLVERAPRIPSALVPGRIAVGSFDDDGGADLIWDLAQRIGRSTTFELAYSKLIGAQRLQALSASPARTVLDLFASDVTGDGHDDIVLITRPGELGNTAEVAVLPTQVPIAPPSIPVDTCAAAM